MLILQVVLAFVSLGVVKFLNNYSQTIYGSVIYLLSLSQFGLLLLNWTATPYIRNATEEYQNSGSISNHFFSRLKVILINYFFLTGFVALFITPLLNFLEINLFTFVLVCLFTLCQICLNHLVASCKAVGFFKWSIGLFILDKFILILILFSLIRSVEHVLLLYILTSLLSITAGVFILLGKLKVKKKKKVISPLIKLALPLLPNGILTYFIGYHFDNFFIHQNLDAIRVADYNIAYQFAGIGVQLLAIIGTLTFPILLRHQNQGTLNSVFSKHYEKYKWLYFSILLIICALFTFLSDILIPIIFKSDFPYFSELLFVFGVTLIFNSINSILLSPVLLAKKNTWISLPLLLGSAVINIGLNIALIQYGLLGVAYATLMASFSSALFLILFLRKKYNFKISFLIQFISLLMILTVLGTDFSYVILGIFISLGFGYIIFNLTKIFEWKKEVNQ